MIKQCKGKDLGKVPKSKLLKEGWYASIKYDGNYVQIHKKGNEIKFYTSGNKEFYIEHIADELINLNPNTDFIIEAEYIADSEGKLGDRTKAAKLTTYRTNYSKGLPSGAVPGRDIFKVFDCIYFNNTIPNSHTPIGSFEHRLKLLNVIELGTHCETIVMNKQWDLDKIDVESFLNKGYEGIFLKHKDHIYKPGKRVNDAIKIKGRTSVDLWCVGVKPGEGKYLGMIGALILTDKEGRQVDVGSGLTDEDRSKPPYEFLTKVIEIEYEQILDTYIQPTFISVRNDKTVKDID